MVHQTSIMMSLVHQVILIGCTTTIIGNPFAVESYVVSSIPRHSTSTSTSTSTASTTGSCYKNNVKQQRLCTLYSASLEEAEDLLYYGVTATNQKRPNGTTDNMIPPKKVIQRIYETWNWSYSKNPETIPFETYKINYRVEGMKGDPPILLVHGFGANINHFRYQYVSLCNAGYRVYAMDLLGFGASDKPLNAAMIGFSIELFTQQIIDFLLYIQDHDGYHNVPWTLAGNSIGGLCCLCTCAEFEKMQQHNSIRTISNTTITISSIILFNTSGGMTGFRYDDVPLWAQPILAFFQYVILGPYIGGYFFRNFRSRENIQQILNESGVYGNRTNVDDELLEILLDPADDDGAEQVFLAVFGGPAGPTAESILPYVKVPVLALWGSNDPWTPISGGLHPGNALPPYHGTNEFTIVPLDGIGHCPHDECPHIVNEKMIAFMKQVATRSE
jgi:pimeloyl-ACP methyl ester carboxylesterase